MRTIKFLLIAGLVGVIAGCKLAVIVVEGGEVQSTGSGTCVAGTVCIVEVTDTNFTDTFTAVPDAGWFFEKWNSGDGFWCQNHTGPTCSVSSEGAAGAPWAEALLASSETFYLMPIFKPYQDIITVDGREWLQPYLFTNLSWDDMNAACPGGRCIDNEMLNGFDMTGWTWASIDDVNALFNYYIGSDVLGPGPDSFEVEFSTAGAFFRDGWRSTAMFSNTDIGGMMSNREESSGLVYSADWRQDEWAGENESIAQTYVSEYNAQQKSESWGGWFYRTP